MASTERPFSKSMHSLVKLIHSLSQYSKPNKDIKFDLLLFSSLFVFLPSFETSPTISKISSFILNASQIFNPKSFKISIYYLGAFANI